MFLELECVRDWQNGIELLTSQFMYLKPSVSKLYIVK